VEVTGLSAVSNTRIIIYYIFVAIGAIHFVYKYRSSRIALFVLLIFWEGLFGFLGNVGLFSHNLYKIIVFSYAVIVFGPNVFKKKNKTDIFINTAFLLFSVFYWITYLLNIQPIFTVASQYGFGYATPYLFYHGIKGMTGSYRKTNYLLSIFLYIVYLQVAFSILKILIFGVLTESIVGSFQGAGGGTAVFFPVLSYLLFYLYKNGQFTLKDWLIILSFFIVSLASAKRAPVFLLPLFILLTLMYVKKSFSLNAIFKYLPFALIILYIGLRTIPSLNPESSTWGSFNIKYAIEYAISYNLQVEDVEDLDSENIGGRAGGLFLVFKPEFLNLKTWNEILFGHGVEELVTRKYGKFVGGSEYGLIHEGGVSEGIRKIYMLGYLGFISYLLLLVSYLSIIRNKKFLFVVFILLIYDFFIYGDILFRQNAIAALSIFICLFAGQKEILKLTKIKFENFLPFKVS